jgi:O-antigen ligase
MAVYWALTSRKKREAIGALAFAVVLVIAVAPPQYWTRVKTIEATDEGTAELRLNYWAAARRMFMTSPIWGVGGRNFGVLAPEYADEFRPERRGNQWGRATHSLYFQLLAEYGLLGVFLIGSVLVANFRDLKQVRALGRKGRCPRSVEQLAECLRLSWVGFLVSGAFISVLSYPHLYYLTALTVVVHRLAFEGSPSPKPEPSPANRSPIPWWAKS